MKRRYKYRKSYSRDGYYLGKTRVEEGFEVAEALKKIGIGLGIMFLAFLVISSHRGTSMISIFTQ